MLLWYYILNFDYECIIILNLFLEGVHIFGSLETNTWKKMNLVTLSFILFIMYGGSRNVVSGKN